MSAYVTSTSETLKPRKSSFLWNSLNRHHHSTRGWQTPPDPVGAKPTITGPTKPRPPPRHRPMQRAQASATHSGSKLYGLPFFKVGKTQPAIHRTSPSFSRNSRLVDKMMTTALCLGAGLSLGHCPISRVHLSGRGGNDLPSLKSSFQFALDSVGNSEMGTINGRGPVAFRRQGNGVSSILLLPFIIVHPTKS